MSRVKVKYATIYIQCNLSKPNPEKRTESFINRILVYSEHNIWPLGGLVLTYIYIYISKLNFMSLRELSPVYTIQVLHPSLHSRKLGSRKLEFKFMYARCKKF
jgi:hypothetical protein